MTTVQNTAAAAATSGVVPQARSGTDSLLADTQNRFLELLVTQLKNQDPLDPMDNAEMTSQIAQLSTVNGINQLNSTLLALAGQLDVSQSVQAAALIGKQVLVPGGKIALGGEGENRVATPFGVDVISPSSSVKVTILDASGKAVKTMDLGPQPPGVMALQWDGKGEGGVDLADGAYTIKVEAVGTNGQPVGANPLMAGTVGSVVSTAQGPKLDLGLLGKFSLLEVKQIMS